MSPILKILMIEDNIDDVELTLLELQKEGYESVEYQQVQTALEMTAALEKRQNWDIIIADHEMPSFDAFSALAIVKERNLDVPFIIVSGTISDEQAVRAMKAGAQDYIDKNKRFRLVPAIEREIKEVRIRREYQKNKDKLAYLALYDDLTELPNRNYFIHALEQRIAQQQYRKDLFAVLFLNLNRYQMVKYSLGQQLGNELIRRTASRLKKVVQAPNILARMRGDEFIILIDQLNNPQEAQQFTQTIQHLFSRPFQLNGPVVYSSSSIGIVISNTHYQTAEEFLRSADIAKHYAQMNTNGGAVVYDASMQEKVRERLQLETDLQAAINYQQLHLNYQPIMCLRTGKITGFEALIRWHHPTKGNISPLDFIPLAEETGLIIPLGQWTLMEACRRLRSWQELYPALSDLSMNVNLSGIQLANPDLIKQVDDLLAMVGLPGHNLKLEITESFLMENLMENPAIANKILEELKARNIKLCIDDFGTGYSSLSYLHYLPIDILKIDRSFINPKTNARKNSEIVKSIINLAQDLGLGLVAEGIETEQQLTMLKNLHCDYGQGYFFARPLDDSNALSFLDKQLQLTT